MHVILLLRIDREGMRRLNFGRRRAAKA